jgi:diacylglycerol kinase
VRAFLKSLGFALAGLRHGLLGQRNVKIQLCCFLLAVLLGIALDFSRIELAFVLIVSALVLCLEMANSALEALADALRPQRDQGVGRAKDLMAGAVLLASLFALAAGALLYLPKLCGLLWR